MISGMLLFIDIPDQVIVLTLLGAVFVLFAKEILPVDIIAILVVLTLAVTGVLPIGEALRGFGNPAVIGVGALFIVSEGLLRTGALGHVANSLVRWSAGSESTLLILILVIVAASSAFLNNTPVVAMFIPIVLGLARRLHFNPSHFLIPLSFAAILGGTCTLIGTSTNIIATQVAMEKDPSLSFGIFDFTPLGVIFCGIGLVYLTLGGRRLIPDRQTITSLTAGASPDHQLREYVTELAIRPGGTLDGKVFKDTVLGTTRDLRCLQLIRGEEILWPPFDHEPLAADDALIIAGRIQDIFDLHREEGLDTLQEIISEDQVTVASHETELAELLVLPNSIYVGKTLEQAQIRNKFGVSVIAIQRHGMHLRRKLSQHPLRVGDVLLVQGSSNNLSKVAAVEGLVLMSGVDDVLVRGNKAPIAFGILVVVIVLLTSGVHMATAALGGALAMVLTGCLPIGRVYESIHWRVLVLIGGTLALGQALDETGAATMIAEWMQSTISNPHWLVLATLVLSALLTECVSNNAVAAIMIPIALRIPDSFNQGHPDEAVSVYPFVMAVAYGASCSFLTPIGYQTNTLVYGAGGYRFGDFARVGGPLVVVIWIVGGFLIPLFWPLRP